MKTSNFSYKTTLTSCVIKTQRYDSTEKNDISQFNFRGKEKLTSQRYTLPPLKGCENHNSVGFISPHQHASQAAGPLSLATGRNQDMSFEILPRACRYVPFAIRYKKLIN